MKNFLKSPKTYILLILLVPIMMLGVFFYNYYQIYKISTDFSSNGSNLSNTKVKNPFEDIDIIEDEEEVVSQTIKGQIVGNVENIELIENSDITGQEKNLNTNNKVATSPSETNKTKNTSYNYILGTYKSRFEKLQKKQEDSLYSLLEQGKAEYIESGAKKTSIINLATKYLNLVNNMENQSDKEFNNLISNLENELKRHSYNTGVVKEIKDYYNYYKKNFKGQMVKKVTDSL